MTLGIDFRHLQTVFAKLDKVTNRISSDILVAALIIGSALIIPAGPAASVWRVPIIGIGLPIAQTGFAAEDAQHRMVALFHHSL